MPHGFVMQEKLTDCHTYVIHTPACKYMGVQKTNKQKDQKKKKVLNKFAHLITSFVFSKTVHHKNYD